MRTFTYALKNGANLANHQGKSWMKTAEKKRIAVQVISRR